MRRITMPLFHKLVLITIVVSSITNKCKSSTLPSFLNNNNDEVQEPPQQQRNILQLKNFAELIYPMTPKKFHDDYFGKKILHLHANNKNKKNSGNIKRSQLFNTSDVINIINKGYIKPMENMKFVFRDIEAFVNDEFNPEDPSSSVVTERTFNDHFDAGHTMLFKHADKHSRKLHEVACVTHEGVGHLAGINVYYSPPDASGFLLHHDGHDLIIVQTMGSKCWKVCEQQFEDQLSVDSKHYTDDPYEDPEKLRCTTYGLRTGDLLYLPRGTLHAPHTMECPGFDDVGGDHSMHLSIGIDVLRSRWMNILQQTIHMYIEQGKEYTMSCAPNKVCLRNDVECDPRQLSYPPLVPFLFANDKKKNSWSWGNILDILLVITVNSDRAVARHLREHFPSNEFGVSSATHVELEKDSETFQNLQFQYEILVHLLGNSCSKLLKSFVKKVLMKRNVTKKEATTREHWVRKHCKAAIKENFPTEIFVPTLITFLKRMRNEFAQKCLMTQEDPAMEYQRKKEQAMMMNDNNIDPPQEMPAFMKQQLMNENQHGGGGMAQGNDVFGDADNVEHMETVDYNRLRQLGVDQMAMNAIRDLFG